MNSDNVKNETHLCAAHQGDYSHYAEHNCQLCVALGEVNDLRARLAEVERERDEAYREGWMDACRWAGGHLHGIALSDVSRMKVACPRTTSDKGDNSE
jgi:hypothetical protein